MIKTCTECYQDFITEADSYGVWHRPHKTHLACGKCFVGLIEPMRTKRITHLESATKDMGEALGWYSDIHENLLDGGKRARETLSKHKELLDQINTQAEKGRG